MKHLRPFIPRLHELLTTAYPEFKGDADVVEPNRIFVHQYMRGLSGMDTHKDRQVVFGAITLVLDDEDAATQAGFYTQNTLEYENRKSRRANRSQLCVGQSRDVHFDTNACCPWCWHCQPHKKSHVSQFFLLTQGKWNNV